MERAFVLLFAAILCFAVNAQSPNKRTSAYSLELSAPVSNIVAKQIVEQINAAEPLANADFDRSNSLLLIEKNYRNGIADFVAMVETHGAEVAKINMQSTQKRRASWNVIISTSE